MKISFNNVKYFNWNATFVLGIGFKQYIFGLIIQDWGVRICFIFWQLIIHWDNLFKRAKVKK